MLVLCSDGLTGAALLDAVRIAAGKGNRAAVVVTADPIYKERNYHVARVRAELESIGLGVDLFDLDTMPAKRLLSYDVVECIGGNPFYLLHAIRAQRAAEVFQMLARTHVLIGWSAAVFVFGPTLALVNQYSPELNEWGISDLRGLGLTKIEALPHYDRFLTRIDGFEQICSDYERKHGVSVLRLNDGDGVWIDGETICVCRGSNEQRLY